jgi:transcriptional regulator with XRE-family HTH domain
MNYLTGTAKELGLSPGHLGHMRRRGQAEIVHAPHGGMAKTWRIVEPERTIGTLLRQKRIAAGLSLEDIADIAGVALSAVGRLERDQSSLKHATMHNVMVALNVRYAEFFAELEGKPAPSRLPSKGRMSYPMAVAELMDDWTGYIEAREGRHIGWRILSRRVEDKRLDWINYCQQLDALLGGWK